jgi:hypothetical protein
VPVNPSMFDGNELDVKELTGNAASQLPISFLEIYAQRRVEYIIWKENENASTK